MIIRIVRYADGNIRVHLCSKEAIIAELNRRHIIWNESYPGDGFVTDFKELDDVSHDMTRPEFDVLIEGKIIVPSELFNDDPFEFDITELREKACQLLLRRIKRIKDSST